MPTQQVGKGSSEASIDQVNIWMRSTPWYQQQMRAWGQDPGHPTLTKNQSTQIKKMAQANGVVVDEGNVELDDHGNFNPIGHKLRNTLVVAGIAAAAIAAPYAIGAVAGGGGSAAGGAAAGGGVLGASTLPTAAMGTIAGGTGLAGASAAAGGASVSGLGLAGAAAAAGAKGMSYGDLLKYGLPIAGNLVGGLIQAKASGAANDAQQKYLEEALAYQKESDLYARTRQSGLDAQEVSRYGDYQGRIAPWIANGTSSNDRMAALLGLPARSGSSSSGGGGRSAPNVDVGDAPQKFFSAMQDAGLNAVQVQGHGQVIADAVNKKYPGLGVTVDPKTDAILWPGIGSIDVTIDSGKGGFNFRPDGYVSAAQVPAATRSYAATVPSMSVASPQAPQPQAQSAATVQMQSPTGEIKAVPAAHVDHYTSLGATPVSGGASSGSGMVSMKGPDGSLKNVSQADVQHYLGLGAVLA